MKRKAEEVNEFDYLIGNTCTYNFQSPRTTSIFEKVHPLKSKTAPAFVTDSTTFVLQGPYDREKDALLLAKMRNIIEKLTLINHFTKDSYGSAYILPESKEKSSNMWYAFRYGGHHKNLNPIYYKPKWGHECKDKFRFDVWHILKIVLLKEVLKIGGKWDTMLTGNNGIYLHSLDTEFDENWSPFTNDGPESILFRQELLLHEDKCSEYIALTTQRIKDVWPSCDFTRWQELVDFQMSSRGVSNNVEQFG